MSAVSIVIQALLADSTVYGIVGDQIEPNALSATATMPAITATLVSENEGYLLTGASGYPNARVQVECVTLNYPATDNLGKAVISALKDFNGAIAGYSAIIFKGGTDATDFSDDNTVHRRTIDFFVRWR